MRLITSKIWPRAGALAFAVSLLATSLTGSAQAAETGTVSGTFLSQAGAGMPNVSVTVMPAGPGNYYYGYTDSEGNYSVANVSPGQYRVRFQPSGFPEQYAFGSAGNSDATVFTVAAGSALDVDDSQLPTGTFSGRLTGRDGTGLANTYLYFSGTSGANSVSTYAWTDPDGYYTVRAHAGQYRISFSVGEGVGNSLTQYIPGSDSYAEAELFTLAVNENKVVNDTVMPLGYITGTFRDTGGMVMPNISVTAKRDEWGYSPGWGVTDSTGVYRLRVKAGSYAVYFNSYNAGVYQYATGKVNFADANTFTVNDGQTITVNDTRLATGSLRVTARDATSGAPISDFWASLGNVGKPDENQNDGVVLLSEVPAGTYKVTASATGYHEKTDAGPVTITAGQQASIEVTLSRQARFDATVVDAQTGQPIAGVCVTAGTKESFRTPDGCQPSGPDGKVSEVLWWDRPGTYQLMAFPYGDGSRGYGAQWVGPTGGVGSQTEAKSFAVQSGQIVDLGLIKMDRAGTIQGKVTPSSGSGVPVYGEVMIADQSWRAGGGYGSVPVDAQGNYVIDFLGPYTWPLRFSARDEVPQWSGAEGNRHQADRIQVTAGLATTYNYQFTPGVTVDVDVTFATGGCELEAYNAATGDLIGGTSASQCLTQGLQLRVLNGQDIKLSMYYDTGTGAYRRLWHLGRDFRSAAPIPVNGPMSLVYNVGRFQPPPIEIVPNQPTPVPVPSYTKPTLRPPNL